MEINGDDAQPGAALAPPWIGTGTTTNYSLAQLAVEMDLALPEAHATLAEVLADLGSWRQAVQEAEAALELEPRNFDAIRVLGYPPRCKASTPKRWRITSRRPRWNRTSHLST